MYVVHCRDALCCASLSCWTFMLTSRESGKSLVRELCFQHGPLAMRTGPIRCWCEWIFDAIFAFLFLSLYLGLLIINYCAQMLSLGRIYDRSCSGSCGPPFVLVHCYELGSAGTMLFASNQRCRNLVLLHPEALQPLMRCLLLLLLKVKVTCELLSADKVDR